MVYKWCVVSQCKNTSIKRPDKLFVSVPTNPKRRKLWLKLARRDPNSIVSYSNVYMCEDHLDMEKAVTNLMKYKMGFCQKLLLADDAVPTKFHFQEDHKTWLSDPGCSRKMTAAGQVCRQRRAYITTDKLYTHVESINGLSQGTRNMRPRSPSPHLSPALVPPSEAAQCVFDENGGEVRGRGTGTHTAWDLRRVRSSDAAQQNTGSDGSASLTAGPAAGMVEVKVEHLEFVEVEMEGPLHRTDQESSWKESQPQTRGQPNTSAVPEVKKEVLEDDYRAMFFKMQEEVTALRIANQSLSEENQILTERNQKLAKEIDALLEKNSNIATVIEYRNKEHDIFTERITHLTDQNECLAKKIQCLTEKCNEFQREDLLGNDCDELQKIEDLTKQLQALLEENKCLNEEREGLVDRNEKMAETVHKLVEDNTRLKILLRRNRRLKNSTLQRKEIKSRRERH